MRCFVCEFVGRVYAFCMWYEYFVEASGACFEVRCMIDCMNTVLRRFGILVLVGCFAARGYAYLEGLGRFRLELEVGRVC